jgi:hypothetical protein
VDRYYGGEEGVISPQIRREGCGIILYYSWEGIRFKYLERAWRVREIT